MKSDDPRYELIRRCFDGKGSPKDLAELEEELKSDAGFRRAYLSYVNIDHALAGCLQGEEQPEEAIASASPSRSNLDRIIPFRNPLASAAAGLVIGCFFATISWALVADRGGSKSPRLEQLIFEESFESTAISWHPGFPERAGVWGGDAGEVVLESTDPLPEHGAGIAKINPNADSNLSYLTRIIEVSELPEAYDGELRQLEVFASFHNEERGLPERYTLRVATFNELPESIHSLWAGPDWPQTRERALTLKKSALSTSGDEAGWQTLSAVVEIPDETRCVVISLAAGRLDPAAPKTVHYFDDVQANLVVRPEPTRPKRKRSY